MFPLLLRCCQVKSVCSDPDAEVGLFAGAALSLTTDLFIYNRTIKYIYLIFIP